MTHFEKDDKFTGLQTDKLTKIEGEIQFRLCTHKQGYFDSDFLIHLLSKQ